MVEGQPEQAVPASTGPPDGGPSIDPAEYAQAKEFYDRFKPWADAITQVGEEPIRKYLTDENYRTFISNAERAQQALQPPDETPQYAKDINSKLDRVDKFIQNAEMTQAQQATMNTAQKQIADLAEKYPAIAENDFKVAKDMAATLIPKGLKIDQYVDILTSIAPTLPQPKSEPKHEVREKAPTSLRGDSGLPGVANTPLPQFDNNRQRGRHIEESFRKALRSS